ncbi:MAG: tail fiber domain-containing protein, partial [Cyclobacteriaceae bacterium]
MKSLLAILFLIATSSLFAQTISVQGVLRDPNGRSVDDGAYSVTFKIYNVATNGIALWSDTYSSLETKHGVFQANLGENATLDGLAFDETYYVGVTVENFAEMTPRIALTIYPYAKAILGQDNKFPSSGNIVLARDSIIVEQGALKFEGADGRIVFNDGTSLNSANFSGPAGSLLNSSSININADNIADGSGAINFQTAGTTRATIANDGNATFDNAMTVRDSIRIGTSTAESLLVSDSSIQALDNGSTTNLILNPNGGTVSVASGSLSIGQNDASRGELNLHGNGTGLTDGGRVNFYKAADHDGDGTATATEYWFAEAHEDDLRIGNIWADNHVMTFSQSGGIGIGSGAYDPQISLAIGDHDTGINWVQDGAINLMSNGNQALSINNGKIGIGDNTPTEAQLVVRGSAFADHFTEHHLDANPVYGGDFVATNWGIYSEQRIMAQAGISTASDARIKSIVGRSNSSSDLEVINKLKITDYTHIDVVNNGKQLEKRLIAQEVDEVYPIAVNKSAGFIPNIYKKASKSSFDNGELTIKMENIHNLKIGDKIKIYSKEGEFVNEVLAVTKKGFTIKSDRLIENAFVYGIEVDDFHTIDYDAIS